MRIWDILEIEKTKDKEAIQAAYRAKLMKTHPEDDPEGFMELRKALEEALKEADRPEEAAEEPAEPVWGDGPVDQWLKKVDQVYKNFHKRNDPAEWEVLLQEDVCQNLDTRIQARNMLLAYMMEHFFLSQKIMQVLDQQLGLMENLEELKEEFPANFLEYIIVQGIRDREYPPYEQLSGEPDADYDGYLRLSSQLTQCIGNCNTEKAHQIIDELSMMDIENPYLGIDHAKVLCQEERFEEALLEVEPVVEEYPEVEDAHLMYGDVAFFLGNYEEAAQCYQRILDKDPDQEWGRIGKAKCLMKDGKYKEANEIFSDIMEKNPYDLDTAAWLKECNEEYILHLKEQMKTSDDQDVIMDLAWCYYQNEQYEDAMLLLEHVEPDEKHQIEQKSLMGRCALYAEKYETALEYMKQWQQVLETLPETEENLEKQKKQTPFCLLLQSYASNKLQDTAGALEQVEAALKLAPEDSEAVTQKGQLLAKQWHLEEAVECFNEAIRLNPESHATYVMRARAYFYMGYYGDAYDDCEKTLEIFPYELAAYVFKIKILIEVGEFDSADEVLQYLESEELQGSELDFLKGFILEARGEEDRAKAIYEQIVAEFDSETNSQNIFNVHNLAEVYHHLAVLEYHTKGSTYDAVRQLIDLGIKEDPEYIQLVEMKAEIAHECRHYNEAMILYKKLERLAPGRAGIYGAMDNLHREFDEWDEALECAEKQLQQTPSGYAYMRRGQIFAYMNRNEEAESDFIKAMQLAPELSYPYNYMGVLRECQGEEEEALEYYLKAITIGEREQDYCDEAYQNAASIFCRNCDYVHAIDMLQRGYELFKNPNFLLEEIHMLRRNEEFKAAEALLKEYRSRKGLGRLSKEYMLEKAHILRDSGMEEAAFDLYDVASVESSEAGLEAGKYLFYKRKYRKALKYFRTAMKVYREEREPDFLLADYCLWASRAALESGKEDEALELAREGMLLIPEDYETMESCLPMILQTRGGLLGILGRVEEAEETLKWALNQRKCDYCLHGICIDAFFEMAYLLAKQGRRREALQCLKQARLADTVDYDLKKLQEMIDKGKL